MSIPGISIAEKIHIKKKLDKILDQEYKTPCNRYITKVSNFNDKLLSSFANEQTYKHIAKFSKKFYIKRNNEEKLNQLISVNAKVLEFKDIKKLLYSTFTQKELKILLTNLDLYIKDENIREYFPKLPLDNSEKIFYRNPLSKYGGGGGDNSHLNIVSPIKGCKNLNEVINKFYVNKNNINTIISNYKKNIKIEEKKISNRIIKLQKNVLHKKFGKEIRRLNFKLDNIPKISESKEFSYELPFMKYLLDKSKELKKQRSLKLIKMPLIIVKKQDKDKFEKLTQKNKSMLSFVGNIENKLLINSLNKRYEEYKLRRITSLKKPGLFSKKHVYLSNHFSDILENDERRNKSNNFSINISEPFNTRNCSKSIIP